MTFRRRWAALALWGLAGVAGASPLEDAFNGPDKPRFFAEAEAAAARGDTEALFLLGKAYHLGVGVEADPARARVLYGEARAQGSARASHNLALMALAAGQRSEAITLLDEALARGLQMPTLHNLGRAHAPEIPGTRFFLREPVAAAGRVGDYYARAYAQASDVAEAFEASRQYLQAWQFARNAVPPEDEAFDLPALRQRAAQWLQVGMDQGHAPSWTNHGVLLYEEGDRDGARAAFERAAAQGVAVAHYHLARMDEREHRDRALVHYEQAALLGLPDARGPAIRLLEDRLRYTSDMAELTQGVDRMAKLRELDEGDTYVLHPPEHRLAWARYLAQARTAAAPLPKRPLQLRACGLDLGGVYGRAFNTAYNTPWTLVAYPSLGDVEPLPVKGFVDDRGCAKASLPPRAAKLLGEGVVLGLMFPQVDLPLQAVPSGAGLRLVLLPVGHPIPPR